MIAAFVLHLGPRLRRPFFHPQGERSPRVREPTKKSEDEDEDGEGEESEEEEKTASSRSKPETEAAEDTDEEHKHRQRRQHRGKRNRSPPSGEAARGHHAKHKSSRTDKTPTVEREDPPEREERRMPIPPPPFLELHCYSNGLKHRRHRGAYSEDRGNSNPFRVLPKEDGSALGVDFRFVLDCDKLRDPATQELARRDRRHPRLRERTWVAILSRGEDASDKLWERLARIALPRQRSSRRSLPAR